MRVEKSGRHAKIAAFVNSFGGKYQVDKIWEGICGSGVSVLENIRRYMACPGSASVRRI